MSLTLSYKYAIATINKVKEIIDHIIVIGNNLLQPHEEDGEVIHAQVKAWAGQFNQAQGIFRFSIGVVQATDIMTYDAIIKVLEMEFQRESELKDK